MLLIDWFTLEMSLDLFLEDICILVLILSVNRESKLNRSIKMRIILKIFYLKITYGR